jgi:hypothetical protein
MPYIKAPQYTKAINPKTGNQEPCYTFSIEFEKTEDDISFITESKEDISLQSLQKTVLENIDWWNNFIKHFLHSSSKFFSKPYTVEQINKITKHTLNGDITTELFPVSVSLLPKTIQILGGIFMVNWEYTTKSVRIDIPDFEESENNIIKINEVPVPIEKNIEENLEELNIDDLSTEINSTDVLHIDSPVKFYEKQRVKEARLKAKLAVYKAQRQMAQYYEKYGNDISDSDNDLETSDDESDNDEEEIQL